jgi:hypothetical protein
MRFLGKSDMFLLFSSTGERTLEVVDEPARNELEFSVRDKTTTFSQSGSFQAESDHYGDVVLRTACQRSSSKVNLQRMVIARAKASVEMVAPTVDSRLSH